VYIAGIGSGFGIRMGIPIVVVLLFIFSAILDL
jgi:hypothetical protein